MIRPPCPSDWGSCIPSKLPLLAAPMRPLLVSGRLKRGGERQLPLGLCVFPAPASTTRRRSLPLRRRAMPLVRRVCSGERHSRDRPSMFALSSLDCYWRCAARSLIAPRDFARFSWGRPVGRVPEFRNGNGRNHGDTRRNFAGFTSLPVKISLVVSKRLTCSVRDGSDKLFRGQGRHPLAQS